MDKSTSNSIIKNALVVLVFLAFCLGIFFLIKRSKLPYYFTLASDFISTPIEKIKSDNERVNILLLGKADKDHAGSDLTDTIIFASVSLAKPNITLISIPRDVWVPEIRAKVNSAYYWGNQREEGGGLKLVKSTMEQIFGVPVHYGLVVDFSGFKSVVDVLGGVDVDVQNSFVDDKYPIAGKENDLCNGDKTYKCRYEVVKFEKGKQLMDGENALKFVRSRNATGDEGTDIAREARQQLVIGAIKEKILSPETLRSPRKLFGLTTVALDSIETDMNGSAAVIVARKVINDSSGIKFSLIPNNFLEHPAVSPKYDNQYVFIPKGGSWSSFHSWVQNLLSS